MVSACSDPDDAFAPVASVVRYHAPDMPSTPQLLTTEEVAKLLHVHPKHVYRLLKKGLPARRVGSEWRFDRPEVLAWSRQGRPVPEFATPETPAAQAASAPSTVSPLVAANGDRVVITLLRLLRESGSIVGLVQSDKGTGLELLAAGRVLATGSHAGGFPTHVGGERLARVHLVTREVGLVGKPGRAPRVRDLARARIASRPPTAGLRQHLDEALAREGLDAREVHSRAVLCGSHLEAACLVARGEVNIGLASRAWANELGLAFGLLAREPYGLLVRARDLGDPAVVRVCEVAQSGRFRGEIATIAGYDSTGSGEIKYDGT